MTISALLLLVATADATAELTLFVLDDGLPVEGAVVGYGEPEVPPPPPPVPAMAAPAEGEDKGVAAEGRPATPVPPPEPIDPSKIEYSGALTEVGVTAADGFLAAELPTRELTLVIRHQGRQLARQDLAPGAGELIRVIVNVGDETEVERSGEDQLAAPTGEEEDGALGILSGRVLEAGGDRDPIRDARIFVTGLRQPLRSDEDGEFSAEVQPGTYAVSVLASGYNAVTRDDVAVAEERTTRVTLTMTPRGLELADFVVTAPHVEGSLASVFDAKRESAEVMEVLGAEQMSRAGDSDAADALARVTGLTVVGGRFVYVRGLGERYSTTLLNGTLLPSPDPTKRVVPLDLFPTDILQSVVVQKTYSPIMPGDFSGGAVTLRTRGVPEEGFLKLGLSVGGNSQSLGKEGLTYRGGDLDLLGIDDGTRAVPPLVMDLTENGAVPVSQLSRANRIEAGQAFPNIYNTSGVTLLPSFGVDLSVGERWGDDDTNVGFLLAALYNNGSSHRREKRADLALTGQGSATRVTKEGLLDRTEGDIDLGGILDVAAHFGKNHTLEAVGVLSRKTANDVLFYEGYLQSDDRDDRITTLEWVEQQMAAVQLRGEHLLPALNNLDVTWGTTYAVADREAPDGRYYRYARRRSEDGSPHPPFELAATTALGGKPMERSYENLSDVLQNAHVNFGIPFELAGFLGLELRGGLDFTQTSRDASVYRYLWSATSLSADLSQLLTEPLETVLDPQHIGLRSRGKWEIGNASRGSDSYTGTHTLTSGFLLAQLGLNDIADLSAGARYEVSRLQVNTSQLINPEEIDVAELPTDDVLPAFNGTLHVTEAVQIRFGFSQTVNRPQLKELSPVPFTDPETRFVRIGNPNLEQASIQNLDLRAEWYWAGTEGLSIAGFFKRFTNPIERVIEGGGPNASGVRKFANVEGAENFGVELEARLGLGRFWKSLNPFSVSANVSLIQSSVILDEATAALLTSTDRPLQGQSPWVVNAQLEYHDEDLGIDGTVLFNMFGERIFEAGFKGLPDAYEQPAASLDVVISYKIAKDASVKLKGGNLLDPRVEVTQGDGTLVSYRRGWNVSLGATYEFSL
jgi:hypothetical protein